MKNIRKVKNILEKNVKIERQMKKLEERKK